MRYSSLMLVFFQSDSLFKVDLNMETAAEAAARLLVSYDLIEGNKESFIEQLNTIFNKVTY